MSVDIEQTNRVRYPGISSRAYEHPADRGALVGLRSVPGFDVVLKAINGAIGERSERLLALASSVRVTENQYTALYQLHRQAATTLDVEPAPELFIERNSAPTAMTIGMDKPFVVVTSGLLDLVDQDELRFVLGHEMGHALSGHALYRTMLLRLLKLATNVAWVPVGSLALRAVIAALQEWFRKSELSADRAGLLVSQDPRVALRAHAKLAGAEDLTQLNTEEFLRQAADYDAVPDARDSVLKLILLSGTTHPMPVVRAAELQKWAASEDYRQILTGVYPHRDDDQSTSWSEEVKAAARSYKESFATSADPLAKVFSGLSDTVTEAAGKVWNRFNGGTRGS